MVRFLSFLLVLLFSRPLFAAKSDIFGVLWTCSNPNETRTFSIGEKDEAGCELHYEKNEKVKTIAWSSVGTQKCVSARDKIIGDLKKAGWKCTKSN